MGLSFTLVALDEVSELSCFAFLEGDVHFVVFPVKYSCWSFLCLIVRIIMRIRISLLKVDIPAQLRQMVLEFDARLLIILHLLPSLIF